MPCNMELVKIEVLEPPKDALHLKFNEKPAIRIKIKQSFGTWRKITG